MQNFFYKALVIFFLSPSTLSASSENILKCDGNFDVFLANFYRIAIASGVSMEAARVSISNSKHLERVIYLDRNQKAFQLGFNDFSARSINDYRLINGKKKIRHFAKTFEKVKKKYGVPPEVITAFWAMETDFGAVQGNFHTLSALATLAHDCRRAHFFQQEFLSSMRLVEQGKISPETSRGAWAGELGHIQMLPTDILNFGSDGDNDGKVLIARSPEDAIVTAAKMLSSKGWRKNQPWMEEVSLPDNFPWREAGFSRERTLKSWRKLGVLPKNNDQFQAGDKIIATLLLPQGRKGPKFLAYPNFKIFLSWNDSFIYATSAAFLANKFIGVENFNKGNPDPILKKDRIVELQNFLKGLGDDVGEVDGIIGAKTRQAVRRIQILLSMPADSWPTEKLLDVLGI